MNEINFLPQSYRNSLHIRQRRVREATVVILVAVSLMALWAYGLTGTVMMRHEALRTESRLTQALGTEQQVAKLTETMKQLAEQRRIQREVRVPIRHHEVIRVLASLVPDSTAFTDLSLENHRPDPAPYRDPTLPVATATPASKAAAQAKKKKPDYIAVQLEGLAPDDLAVASLIASMSEHPLFHGVKLHSSRFVDARGLAARQFRVTAAVDLSRDYRWVDPVPQSEDAAPDAVAEVSP